MFIESFPLGPVETNAILIGCENTKQAAIIDAPFGAAETLLPRIKELGLIIKMILLTHSHWDHTAEAAQLREKLKVPLMVHKEDAGNVERPGSDRLPQLTPIKGVTPDHYFVDGEIIPLGDLQIKVIHTPGHTPGGVCFYLENERVLISGDTLFQGTIGNISFPTARPALMWESLKKLAKLPPETRVFPGHGDPTTIGEEKWIINAEKRYRDE